jgi:hypothetical protein
VPRGYKKDTEDANEYRTAVEGRESNFVTPACRDMSLGAEELNLRNWQLQTNGKK